MVDLKPRTIAVETIITVILNAIAAIAIRMMILEKDFLVVTPTLRAMKKDIFNLTI